MQLNAVGSSDTTGTFARLVPAQGQAAAAGQAAAGRAVSTESSDQSSPTLTTLKRQLEVAQQQLARDLKARADKDVVQQDQQAVSMAAAALAAAMAEQAANATSSVDTYA